MKRYDDLEVEVIVLDTTDVVITSDPTTAEVPAENSNTP